MLSFFASPITVDKCEAPLGIQDGRITQSMMSASTFYNRYYGPWSARLQARNHGATRGGWIARINNNRQWLQIDLGAKSVVKKIATQGRYDANQWVTSYTLSISNNAVRFYPYKENRRTRVSTPPFCLFVSLENYVELVKDDNCNPYIDLMFPLPPARDLPTFFVG